MNRAQRRAYLRTNKRNPLASYCEKCKGKTLHIAIPVNEEECVVVCECCKTITIPETKGLAPYEYVKGDVA